MDNNNNLINIDVDCILNKLTPSEIAVLYNDWYIIGRKEQNPDDKQWFLWLILAGRGWGKTRTGAQWVNEVAFYHNDAKIALISHNSQDGRHVMVEGESGVLNCCPPWFQAKFEPSKRLIRWPNGASAQLFSATSPNQLRGPQFSFAWCDELAKWKGQEAWHNLMFALRLGRRPQCVITTTPRPIPLLDDIMNRPDIKITHGHTFDNADNLPNSFIQYVKQRYDGTVLGRQELSAEIIRDVNGALWTRAQIDNCRIDKVDTTKLRIIIAVDPAISYHDKSDETGIIVAGWDGENGYVLSDASGRYSPDQWAKKVIRLFETWQADRIVAEINQGGAMVSQILRTHAPNLPIQTVHASKGKTARAEPIAALYEQGKIHHVGVFTLLEDQMCNFTGLGKSPDHLDALVWALTALAFTKGSTPSVGRV